ncbi:Protein of uncharacterised function (DUF3015) [Pseudomonas aeruginosa]|nr:Protein of uncharacterised function (DUF3015) [Pseudomonas aeruginosa]
MDKRLLSKGLVLGLLSLGSMTAHADAAGGNGCGWGNMVFEGQRGLFPHLLATTTNGTSGNATFGMTSGTNGCNTNARLGYGGRSIFAMNGMLDNIAEDMAKGQGEALDAYAVLLGVEAKDRAHFAQVTQQHFGEIFASKDATGEQVLSNTLGGDESRRHPGALRQATGLRPQAQERARYGGLFRVRVLPAGGCRLRCHGRRTAWACGVFPGRFLRRGQGRAEAFSPGRPLSAMDFSGGFLRHCAYRHRAVTALD